jgi:dihydrodipicolinate synthase/N-acetylneuraminate lyase
MKMKRMHGVIVPIVTPFDAEGNVDVAAIGRLIDYLVEQGVHSVYPNGTTGEMLKLSVEERKLVAETVMKAVDGRIEVYVHVGAPTTAQTIELARHAHEIGSDGVGVVTPQFFGVNEREMEEFYVEVSKSLPDDFPVYLYNIPQCAANDLTPAVVDRIVARTKNVVGIKYSYADMVRLKEYLGCNGGEFDVVVGPDRLFLSGMTMGCVGTVSGCSQCGPKPFVQTYDRFIAGDLAGAMKAQKQATALIDIVRAGANMAYFKAALEYNGLGVSHMRRPALDLTAEEKKAFFEQLKGYAQKYGAI